MNERLTRLKEAVASWHQNAKKELEAEASFLEKVQDSFDDVEVSRHVTSAAYSDLIADTIRELVS